MAAPVGQNNWRFCTKCYCLWWNGNPTNGVCPAGGEHLATASGSGRTSAPAPTFAGGSASWDIILIADPVPYPGTE
jgi:hypothetical protein